MEASGADHSIPRRAALKRCLLGSAVLAAAGHRPVHAAPAPPRAKSVIQIWMWGGPCHLDTFDPKPDAGRDYCGPLGQAVETNVPGIRINAALPMLAQQADKYAILRSMTHGINGHETASYMVQTGCAPGRLVFPSAGAVVSLFKGYDHGYTGIVPPYIVLTELQGRFSEAGFLGQRYKPFATGGDPAKKPFAVEGIVAEGISDERQRSRRSFLHALDTLSRAYPDSPALQALDRSEESAYGLMFGEARSLFDLSQEAEEVRERYGKSTFGQSCLTACRLVEQGVPYVTINYKGWDTHKQHFEAMTRKLPELDQGMSALLEDLHQRGLLDSTIVWWGGEFGRTPKILWEAPWNGGRGHFGNCFCSVVAGGGFRGGTVVGASDACGEEVAERPVYPADLIGTLYTLLGINPDGPLPNSKGIEVNVLPAPGPGEKRGGLLKEIVEA